MEGVGGVAVAAEPPCGAFGAPSGRSGRRREGGRGRVTSFSGSWGRALGSWGPGGGGEGGREVLLLLLLLLLRGRVVVEVVEEEEMEEGEEAETEGLGKVVMVCGEEEEWREEEEEEGEKGEEEEEEEEEEEGAEGLGKVVMMGSGLGWTAGCLFLIRSGGGGEEREKRNG